MGLHDIHIWIGKESSQDEYGTAAYKMVELDEYLGGGPIQHREVEGGESPMFQSYFDSIKVLDGGVDTGFRHIEATKEKPHLYKIKGTEKGMSMTQISVSKSSLNQGDSFILFASKCCVFVLHGETSNPDEKAKANRAAEEMCVDGTVNVIESSEPEGDNAEFWAYLGDGTIAPAEGGDEEIKDYVPVLYLIKDMVRVRRLISKRLPWPSLSSDVLDPLFRKFPSPCWTTAMYFCWILVGKCTCGWENLATRVKNLLECLWQIVT